jgi:hypothetical protein
MSAEEKRAWIMAVVTGGAYAGYVTVVVGAAHGGALAGAPYVATMLWTIGIAVLATVVLNVVAATASPSECEEKDQRDREIYRFGEYLGHWVLVAGAVAALGMSMVRLDYFWIANIIYLAFVVSAIIASLAKIVAYRRGFQPW